MSDTSSRTLVCSVAFLDIAEYSKKPVAAQLQAKQRCSELLAAALEPVAVRDRIVLETGDGVAITFLGDPEDALLVAMSLRGALAAEPAANLNLRIGVNLGPVRLVRDPNGQTNVIGDGVSVAQRVMAFARPGELLVSRAYYEAVSRRSHDHAGMFKYVGARTDKHVREHEVYSVGADAAATQRLTDTLARHAATGTRATGWRFALAQPGPFGVQWRGLLAGTLIFALLAGSGVGLRAARQPASTPPPIAAAPARPSAAGAPPVQAEAVPAQAAPARPPEAPARRSATTPGPHAAPREKHASAVVPASATVKLAIAPWGEVLVDGKVRGVSPPLTSIELPPGTHTIEIRNTTFPSHVERVELQPGEKIRVRHLFQ